MQFPMVSAEFQEICGTCVVLLFSPALKLCCFLWFSLEKYEDFERNRLVEGDSYQDFMLRFFQKVLF